MEKTIKLRLKELRKEREIDQKVLAIDLKVSQPTISDWENNQMTPSIENIIQLADYFDVSLRVGANRLPAAPFLYPV